MKFNPKIPVDIHNPFPAHKWPIRKGRKVLFFDTRGPSMPTPKDFRTGTVRWYHPARDIDHCCVITPGHPFFGVDAGNGVGGICYVTAGVDEVAPNTKAGRKELTQNLLRLYEKTIREEQQFIDRRADNLRKLGLNMRKIAQSIR